MGSEMCIRDRSQSQPFRWFTAVNGASTYIFNPLGQEYLKGKSALERADLLSQAMGLQYGRTYGPGFFSDANMNYLSVAIEHADKYGGLHSFRDLELAMMHPLPGLGRRQQDDASHVKYLVRRLADLESLNASRKGGLSESQSSLAIDFSHVFRSPQTVYFHLSSEHGSQLTADIGRMVLHSLFKSALAQKSAQRKQTYVIIDEFQRLLAPGLDEIFQQARSLNISLIVANQAMDDLKRRDVDLTTTIDTNTRLKQYFSVTTDHEVKKLSNASGGTIIMRQSTQHSTYTASDSVSLIETEVPRLSVNDLTLISAKEKRSVLRLRQGQGFAQYGGFAFAIDSDFTISPAEYNTRKQASWPSPNEHTIVSQLRETRSIIDEEKDDESGTEFLDEKKDDKQDGNSNGKGLF